MIASLPTLAPLPGQALPAGVQKSLGKQHNRLVALSRTHHCTADPIRTQTV